MLLLLSLLLAAGPAPVTGNPVERAIEELAEKAVPAPEPSRLALLVLTPGCDALREPIRVALSGALARRGQDVLPVEDAESANAEGWAMAHGADALLKLHVTLSEERLALVGELVPTRENFFLQRHARAGLAGSRLVTAVATPDAALKALVSERARGGPIGLVPLGRLDVPLLALAAGPTRLGAVRLVAVTPAEVLLLDEHGIRLDARPLSPFLAGPRVRDASAVVAVGDFGQGRIAYAVAGHSEGEILSAEGDRLERVAGLPPVGATQPIASGGAGPLFGAFVPGRGVLADLVLPAPDPAAQPSSGRELFGAAAAPHPGRAAFAVLGCDYTLRILGTGLEAAYPEVPGVGVGFALADLEGDGEPLLVVSSATPGPRDRIRVLRPGARDTALFEAEPGEGTVVAAAAADVTGDGLDDAVLATSLPSGGTELWLLTADGSRDRR
ncbi:MAG TPA: VCBS repeat-containing protein [Anaeromyxobacteraceae bacterium]|nr:VCBS repeat-containing protein [Anaeromyxobacteraceae bacterium]